MQSAWKRIETYGNVWQLRLARAAACESERLQVGFFDKSCANLYTESGGSNYACVPPPGNITWDQNSTAEFSCYSRSDDGINFVACGGSQVSYARLLHIKKVYLAHRTLSRVGWPLQGVP